MTDITLSTAEVQRVAGGYERPSDQLRELRRLGLYRARLGAVTREVILERAHYDAVCAGRMAEAPTPRVRQPQQRSA